MKVAFRQAFAKDLKKLCNQSLLDRIKSAIEVVETASSLNEVTGIKRLEGEDSYFRIRIGDYRVGLILLGDTVVFVRVIHRKEFYRYFP